MRHNEPFMSKHWRGLVAFSYVAINLFDFIGGPCLSFWFHRDWHSITLEGGGLFHISMGAVLGVSSWGKTQERTNLQP